MNADYSHRTLIQKLGFQPGDTVFVETTPDWYSKFADENGLDLTSGLPATHAHIFCESKQDLLDFLNQNSLEDIEKSLWLSWPKKSSGVKADVNDHDFREQVLPTGWVDVKVAAIDDTWSGAKFVRRKN